MWLFANFKVNKDIRVLQVGQARLYYETAGQGAPIVFIHAGVADCRQWNNEFVHFNATHQVIRYDMRGFGKSHPVPGEFTHLDDLTQLLDHLELEEPVVLIGCSMGGSTALDYALRDPSRVSALILVDSAPSGLQLDVPVPEKFKWVEEADAAGDLLRVAELETQIWFDGDRPQDQVDPSMRNLAYEMNLTNLRHDALELGDRLPNTDTPAVQGLAELRLPVLCVVGDNDIPYMHAAVDVMRDKIPDCRVHTIDDAAHLPNMDQPAIFATVVGDFLQSLPAPRG